MIIQPFVIERTLKAPIQKVWEAITDKNKMKEWYFDLPDFKAEVGLEFRFYGGPDDRQYLHICEVTEVVPNQKLTYSWRYDGEPGISYVTFELIDLGLSTKIRLTHSHLESFSSGNPDLARQNFEAGWTDLIGNLLKAYVEK